jgi:hypothetical protein
MTIHQTEHVQFTRRGLSRRSLLRSISAGAIAAGTLSFQDLMCLQAGELRRENRAMILLWMNGGPSQFETFDPKPGTKSGGPTEAIRTATKGIRIAQGWDKTAKMMDDIAIVRSMTNKEGSHPRASYQMHTGYVPSGSVKHPSLASCVVQQLGDADNDLPSFVSVGNSPGGGFLGVDYDPFMVSNAGSPPANTVPGVEIDRYNARLGLLDRLQGDFARKGGREAVENQRRIYRKAANLVKSPSLKAFDISAETDKTRERYGDSDFGRGCLLARRLVESGVTFVEVRSPSWDTHTDNFARTGTNIGQVDPGMAALIGDLKDRGMLDRTLVVCMGEFGRTPNINARNGRDHFPRCFNLAMAGGGVRGGQVIGSSTRDGSAIKDNAVTVHDLFQTVCKSMQVDPNHENISPLGRPMKVVDGGNVIEGLLG